MSECLEADVVAALAVGRLEASMRAVAEHHLEACQSCRWVLARACEAGAPNSQTPTVPERVGRAGGRGAPLEGGTQVGRYVLTRRIAVGGMGEIYAAVDPRLNRGVCVKLVQRAGKSQATRMSREAEAMARIAHPNVVPIFDVGTWAGGLFLTMELVDGQNLREWLHAAPRPVEAVLDAFLSAGEGLAAAHAVGVVHRDFKLDNVLIDSAGRVRVTDFGLARAADEEPDDDGESSTPPAGSSLHLELTAPGTLVGTPGYQAPETLHGQPADTRSDQYSYCVSLHRALFHDWPAPSTRHERDVPRGVTEALQRGLDADPAARFPSMEALLAALRAPKARAQRRKLAALVTAMVVVPLALTFGMSAMNAWRCRRSGAAVSAAWSENTRVSVRAAFIVSGRAHAPGTFERVDRALRAWTDAWSAERVAACADANALVAAPGASDSRLACLDELRSDVAALTERWRDADAQAVDQAVAAVGALERPASCQRPGRPLSSASPELRAALRRGRVAYEAGQFSEVDRELAPFSTGASSAEVGLFRGMAFEARGQLPAALQQYESAALTAERLGEHARRFEAHLRLTRVYGGQGRLVEARNALEMARAIREAHLPRDEASRAEMLVAEAGLCIFEKNIAAALALLDEALPLAERTLGPDSELTLRALNTRVVATYKAGAARASGVIEEELYQRTVRRFGRNHPRVLLSSDNRAVQLLSEGRVDEALAMARGARTEVTALLGAEHPVVGRLFHVECYCDFVQSELDDARAACEAALEILERPGAKRDIALMARMDLARIAWAQGRHADAVDLARLEAANHPGLRTVVAREELLHHPTVAGLDGLVKLANGLAADGDTDVALENLSVAEDVALSMGLEVTARQVHERASALARQYPLAALEEARLARARAPR